VGKGGRCVRLTTYHHPVPLSRNLGTLNSWNPLGPSEPVTGLLYLYCDVVSPFAGLAVHLPFHLVQVNIRFRDLLCRSEHLVAYCIRSFITALKTAR